jgi:glycosyltransferase involved in cell wall biosynthesis
MMGNGETRQEEVEGVIVHRLPLQVIRGSRVRYIFQYLVFLLGSSAILLSLHLRRKFDIVHVHSLPDFQVFCATPERLLGTRVVLDLHEAMPELFASRFGYRLSALPVRIMRAVERLSCEFADCVIVVNSMMQRRLLARGVMENKLLVVMNSPPAGSVSSEGGREARDKLGLGAGPAIVYVGGVNRERDLTTLVEAISMLQATHNIGLVIIGYGEEGYRSELQSLAEEHGLDRFILRGRVPHKEAGAFMSVSEVGTVTYERNYLTDITMPTKALEYSAAGKPLVIANLRGIREVYGDAALYYEPGEASDLARKVGMLLDNRELAAELAERGRAVLMACSWNIMERRLLEAYRGLASRQPRNKERPSKHAFD